MWFLKLKTWATMGDWQSIENLARAKKNPPIGWKPFADMAVKKGQKTLAEQFIMRVNDPEYQLLMYQHIECYMRAAEVAVKLRNEEVLEEIFRKTDDPEVRNYIESGGKK